jgi:FXSXX-COOH protein
MDVRGESVAETTAREFGAGEPGPGETGPGETGPGETGPGETGPGGPGAGGPLPDLLALDLAELRTIGHPVLREVVQDLRERAGRSSETLWGFDAVL